MSETKRDSEIGRWGPFIINATAHDDRIGWVITVTAEGSREEVQIRTSAKGRSGMRVRRVLYQGRRGVPTEGDS